MELVNVPSDCTIPEKGSQISNPHLYFKDISNIESATVHLQKGDLRSAIIQAFNLSENDSYVYHAIASVTLSQVQAAVEAGSANGLCDWYVDRQGTSVFNIAFWYNIRLLTLTRLSLAILPLQI